MNRKEHGVFSVFVGVFGVLLSLGTMVCVPKHIAESDVSYLAGTGLKLAWLGVGGYVLFIFWSCIFFAVSNSETFLAKFVRLTHHLAVLGVGGFTVYLIRLAIQTENVCPRCLFIYFLNIMLIIGTLSHIFASSKSATEHHGG